MDYGTDDVLRVLMFTGDSLNLHSSKLLRTPLCRILLLHFWYRVKFHLKVLGFVRFCVGLWSILLFQS